MKALQSAGVFGLLPVPPVPEIDERGRPQGPRPAASEDDGAAPELVLSPSLAQRMAKQAELSRLRQWIEAISAD